MTPKLVVIAVVLRKHPKYGIQVHTQTRNVLDLDYDPYYGNTLETVGETVKPEENVIAAVVRGCQEELGNLDLEPVIIGDQGTIFTTRYDDQILGFQPYYFTQQLKGPQPWVGPTFIVVVPPEFEPQQDTESETSAHQWWGPQELLDQLLNQPQNFMGLHYPALIKATQDLLSGALRIP